MMLVTLAWKEFCEHRAIWLTMVVMTCVLGTGLARIVAPDDAATALAVASLSILGMAGAYGVVCGAMMLAGEHESGTLAFLDIFLGRRHLLWTGKLVIGVVFAATEALLVGCVLMFLKQMPPVWAPALIGIDTAMVGGFPAARPEWGPVLWLLVLPIVTVEAFAWGLFGSALTRRVLSAAAVAALVAAPVWLIAAFMPAPAFLTVRLAAAFLVLLGSYCYFFAQARETSGPMPSRPAEAEASDPRRRFMELWAQYERQDRAERGERAERVNGVNEPVDDVPIVEPIDIEAMVACAEREPITVTEPQTRRRKVTSAGSPAEALCWLTFQQARDLCLVIAGLAIVVGLFIPVHGGVLWPIATMLLGVACGVAAFAPEQRDLSYQFLAAQHLPLPSIWRFKIGFWSLVAVLGTLIPVFSGLVVVFGRFVLTPRNQGGAAQVPLHFQLGTLREVLGPVLFHAVWLVYGFCSGQIVVWFCRKTILAVLLSLLVGGASLGLWLPSLLCRGMSSWPLWIPPLIILGATQFLVRAWAGGRIKERRPLTALVGCVAAVVMWVGLNLGHRAIEVPAVVEPLDTEAFRDKLSLGEGNRGAMKIQEAITLYDERGNLEWQKRMAEAAELPTGIIEAPRSDGGAPLLRHLPTCDRMAQDLRILARKSPRGPAFDYLTQILVLSRNLRNKAPAASYFTGVNIETSALEGLDEWLKRGRPTAQELERVLKELNRHAGETMPPEDCAEAECFRAGGLVKMPGLWAFASTSRDLPGRVPERWLAGAIAVSLELPWEDERKIRLWQLVWAGLMRGIETPHWKLPTTSTDPGIGSEATRAILRGWLPGDGSPSRLEVARLLDASWLTDERLFCPVVALRTAGTRARWRVDSTRLAVALALYALAERKSADKLDDLVPKYLPELPTDPYSGQGFQYRVSAGERITNVRDAIQPGQGVLWSTGPDRADHGARNQGEWMPDDNAEWGRGGYDLITPVPHWR